MAVGESHLSAGIWCTAHTPKGDPGTGAIHPHPFLKLENWRAALLQVDIVYADVMTALATFLDAHNNSYFGISFWEHILGWFVRCQTEVAIERAKLLNDIFEKHPNAVFIGLDPQCYERPIDTKNFVESLRHSHVANLQLMTQVSQFLNLDVETRELPEDLKGRGMSRVFVPGEIRSTAAAFSISPDISGSSTVFYKALVRKRAALALRILSCNRARVLHDLSSGVASKPADKLVRKALANAPCKTDMGRLTLSLLANNLPTALLEEWRERARVLEGLKPYPKVIVTGLGSFWNIDFAIWSAAARREGTRFIGLQHGGTYGERDGCSFEAHERKVSDTYITWGWSEGSKTTPLPAPRLSGILKRRRPVKNGPILWIGTSDTPYVYQLGPRPIGPQFERYFASQRIFDKELDATTRAQVLFRPYPTPFGWSEQPGHTGTPLKVACDDFSKNFHQRMTEAKLVVIDHPGSTTMLEALAAEIPAICFGNPADFDIRPSAAALYDRLAEQGLYYRSASDAAHAVNLISADIPSWWAMSSRQATARAFADTYARHNGFLRNWQRFISACQ